jgi:tetratricopeptide (TPR) repeat protein
MEDDKRGGASTAWRDAMTQARPGSRGGDATESEARDRDHTLAAGPPVIDRTVAPVPEVPARGRGRGTSMQPPEWERVEDLEETAADAVARGRAAGARRSPGGAEDDLEIESSVRAELARAVGTAKVERYEQRLRDATRAFESERFADALRMLKKLADEAPSAAAVRELYGLTLYRLGRWRPAAKELEAFRVLSSSTEQHPVLADCYRALGQHKKVPDLWQELKEASPSAALVTEGRIVAAGSLADQGDVRGAVTLLEQGFSFPKRPKDHHLRRAYALADCYERAGDVVRARELFAKVSHIDPWFADVKQRERALN